MKSSANPSRLLWLGGILMLAGVSGSQSDESPASTHLRGERRRNSIVTDTIGESIHEAKTNQFQQIADAVGEGTGSSTPASDQTAFSARNGYGYDEKVQYYQNVQPHVYQETPIETNDPNVAEVPTAGPSTSYGTTTDPTTVAPSSAYSNPTTIPSEITTEVPTLSPTIVTEDPTPTPTIVTEDPTFTPTIVTEGPTPMNGTEAPTFTPTIVTDGPTDGPTTAGPTVGPTTAGPTTLRPTLDPNSNTTILTLLDVAGVCNGPPNGIGCANQNLTEDPAGNPNDIVNCYNANIFGVDVPFSLDAIRVWLGDTTVLTPDLQVNVWVANRNGTGPITDRLLYSEDRFGYTFGENIFKIGMGRMMFQSNFCVGVTARSSNAGLRIMADTVGAGDSSFLRSPECGFQNFTSLADVGLQGDFCIEALVSSIENFR